MHHNSPPLTLRSAWERHYRSPFAAAKTIESYLNALTHWERLTGNPDLHEVTTATLLNFKHAFLAEGRPATTFNKVRRHVMAIFHRLGPPAYGNPEGLSILPAVPFCRKETEPDPDPRVATEVELSTIFAACETATWPRYGGCPVLWWRTLLVLLYNIGARRTDALRLQWEQIDLAARILTLSQSKTGKTSLKPINSTLAAYLEELLRQECGPLVFPAMREPEIPVRVDRFKTSMYRQWERIQTAAGLAKRQHITLHDLRRTCATAFDEVAEGSATSMLDHASARTTQRHYLASTAKLKKLQAAAERIPQPFGVVGDDPEDDGPDVIQFPTPAA